MGAEGCIREGNAAWVNGGRGRRGREGKREADQGWRALESRRALALFLYPRPVVIISAINKILRRIHVQM
jgi:hypothetical protein